MIIVEDILGFHLIDESGKIIESVIYPRKVRVIAERLYKLYKGELVNEIIDLLSDKEGITVIASSKLAPLISRKIKGVNVRVDDLAVSRILRSLPKLLIERGLISSVKEYLELKKAIGVELSRIKIREAQAERDQSIVQAINAVDELNKTINTLVSRIREWYGLYFPEMEHIIKNNELYAKLVSRITYREDMNPETLIKIGVSEDLAIKLNRAASTSAGGEMDEDDLNEMRRLAGRVLELYDLREKLERYIDKAMSEVAPNVRGLVGPTIGARLIALAGGLKKLALMPSSTIQVLGAEKALFRALRYGAKPPKHGVIYQHPLIHRSPKWQRGKIARALAGKLSIAARIDYFSGEDKISELKADLDARIKEIKATFPKPPARKVEKPPVKVKRKIKKKKKRR